MEGVATSLDREVHELRRVEVARDGVRADAVSLIRALDVQRLAVGFGVDGHGLNAHLTAGAGDAHGNLATIRDQDLLDHSKPRGHRIREVG